MSSFVMIFCACLWFVVCFLQCVESDVDGEACQADGVHGACVPLEACAQYVVLLKNPATTLEGLRVTGARQCGFHGASSKVCCPTNEPIISTTPVPPSVDPNDFVDAFPNLGECGMTIFERLPYEYSNSLPSDSPQPPEYEYHYHDGFPYHTPPPPLPPISGGFPDEYKPPPPPLLPFPPLPPPLPILPNNTSSQDIPTSPPYAVEGGKPVRSREMALWMALLGYQKSAVFWKCGGSIISARHVLTAAHCIKPNLYIVRVGEIDLANPDKNYSPIDFLVKRTIIHEEYTKFHNDIGVVVLKEKIDFENNKYIAPVCLPTSPKEPVVEELLNSETGLITGWGETEKVGERPSHLLYAYVKILDNKHCAGVYREKNVTIDSRVICAGGEDDKTDACNGDSGGPLVNKLLTFKADGSWHYSYFQLGIVSYGFRCSARRHSGVYTNLTHFMPWLEEKVLGRPAHWSSGT